MTEETATPAAPESAPPEPVPPASSASASEPLAEVSASVRVKRKYTLSPLALAQRQAAALKSTGPKTEAGKAISSRNAWVHGMSSAANLSAMNAFAVGSFGKPCKTTCPKHPDNPNAPEHPCSLVLDGLTQAGKDCLDKEVYVKAFQAIETALESGDMSAGMNGVLAAEMAGVLEMLQALRAEIGERGLLITVPIFSKMGEEIGERTVPNPAMGYYIKLLEKSGLSLPQLLATPAARARVPDPEGGPDPVADLFSRVLARGGNKPVIRGETVDGEYTEHPDA